MKSFPDIFIYFIIFVCSNKIIIESKGQYGKFILSSAVIKCEEEEETGAIGPSAPDLTVQSSMNRSIESNIEMKIKNLKTCKRKLLITLKIITYANMLNKSKSLTNRNQSGDEGTLIQIGPVIDENNRTVYLSQPVVIKIQQLPVVQVYPIKYLNTINAKVYEEVSNKENTQNFKGCPNFKSSICGNDEAEDIETNVDGGSRGFCCSCTTGNVDKYGRQFRGGQLCENNASPAANQALDASAHCIRLSKFWYAVHNIGPPEVFQEVFVQVFKRLENEDGAVHWSEIPGGPDNLIRVDSHETQEYQNGELSVKYRRYDSSGRHVGRLYQPNHRLLVPKLPPDTGPNNGENKTKNDRIPKGMVGNLAETYLVFPDNIIDSSGQQCDKAGVTYSAFVRAKSDVDPCHQPKGSCLNNQPLDLWTIDDKSSTASRMLQFKLKHFGPLYLLSPMKQIKNELYLVFEPQSTTTAYVDITLPVDELFVVKPGYSAAIFYVISDSSFSLGKLMVQVANTQFVPGYFTVHVLECTEGVLDVANSKTSTKLILPQTISTFIISLPVTENAHLSRKAICTVAVINKEHEIVAVRDGLLSPGDSCICKLHCQCLCSKDDITTCQPIKPEKVLAAGLSKYLYGEVQEEFASEDLPSSSGYTSSYNNNFLIVLIFTFVIIFLLLLGVIKAILGIFWKIIDRFGLGYFYNRPKTLTKYYEKNYSRIDVIYDSEGFPLDPFTKKPTVQRLKRKEMFLYNVIFFIILPWLLLTWICGLCCKCGSKSLYSPSSSTSVIPPKSSSTRFPVMHNKSNSKMTNQSSRYKGTQSEPLLAPSATDPSQRSSPKATRVNSVRRSDSSMEYSYRRTQGGGTEYSVNGSNWRTNPVSFSQSDTSLVTTGNSRHIPSSEIFPS